MRFHILTAFTACALVGCASRGFRNEHHANSDEIEFASQWEKHRLAANMPRPAAVKGNPRNGWTLNGARKIIHRPGALHEFSPGHFTCSSAIEFRNGTEKATAPSILDRNIINEPDLIQSIVFLKHQQRRNPNH